jgi:hypothetical protein
MPSRRLGRCDGHHKMVDCFGTRADGRRGNPPSGLLTLHLDLNQRKLKWNAEQNHQVETQNSRGRHAPDS